MNAENEELNAYLCDRRNEELNNKDDECLVITRYNNGFIAWVHGKVVYEYEFPAYRGGVFNFAISDTRDLYRLGSLYYDFTEGLKKLGIKPVFTSLYAEDND
jgi:hypothetical protein